MLRWFPWKQLIGRLARSRGLIDPVKLLSRLESFAQPLEVKEPLELLRAGLVFHARGLLNSSAIQYNLDWIWPFWVERQYDPYDDAFLPRAFSVTHVNLTHRNWTAVGLPDFPALPIVDPRGLVTPLWDGWSLDAWIIDEAGHCLVPSRADRSSQSLDLEGGIAVLTTVEDQGLHLESRVELRRAEHGAELCLTFEGTSDDRPAHLVAALRPYNPEGVSFIHHIELSSGRDGWSIDHRPAVRLDPPVEIHKLSSYHRGDVRAHLHEPEDEADGHIECRVGMATAAALYRLQPTRSRILRLVLPLRRPAHVHRPRPGASPAAQWRVGRDDPPSAGSSEPTWSDVLETCPGFETPDSDQRFLYDAAVRTLILHSPDDVYPGPYTYLRFWFRDAAFILDGLLCLGLFDRVERVLDTFPARQTRKGHFLSQEGEWDSNGEALWILERACRLSGRRPKEAWRTAIRKSARWIGDMRMPRDGSLYAGLLPAGFSAEHLGPNDYYYWDDFWSVKGLRCAARLLADLGGPKDAAWCLAEAADLEQAIDRSLDQVRQRLGRPAVPASPHRRLDAGVIGSLAAGYPLALWSPTDPRLLDSVEFLLKCCFVAGGFFQDMIHSGINPYLTLHVAQVLQRAGDPRAAQLTATVAGLASPTGQWPEAVHPRTGGGCMGDGQHAWAAAEWILLLRNSFVREEDEGLVLAAGMTERWADGGRRSFGPTPTSWGPITVTVEAASESPETGAVRISWHGDWRGEEPAVSVQPMGRVAQRASTTGRHGSIVIPAADAQRLLEVPR